MAQPDARTLEIFRAVAAAGSATRAAEKLNTTQPNITRAIGAFEKECGFALFERGRYGMTLTPAGEQLLEVVQRNWWGLKSIGKAIDELRDGPPGMLRTVAIPFLAEGALAALLSDFIRDHPQIAVAIKAVAHDFVYTDIEIGGSDIGMIIGPRPIGTSLSLMPFGESRLALAVPFNHRLANRASVEFSELHGERFVQLTQPNHIRLATDAMLARVGARPLVMHEVATQRTLVELVRRGDMVGLADLEMVQSCAGEVVPVAVEPAVSWPVNLVYNGNRTHSTMLKTFLDWLAGRSQPDGAEAGNGACRCGHGGGCGDGHK